MTDDEGIFRDRKLDYRRAETVERIEVPQDLDAEALVDFHEIPDVSPDANKEFIYEHTLPAGVVVNLDEIVKIDNVGDDQWVLVRVTPSQLWPRLMQYFSDNGYNINFESGDTGFIEANNEQGTFRIKVDQGFQRLASEVRVRQLNPGSDTSAMWPSASDNREIEDALLDNLQAYLLSLSDSYAFSYRAQSIETQKKLGLYKDKEGNNFLVLHAEPVRANAAIRNGLKAAGFRSLEDNGNNLKVAFLPPYPKGMEPGFWTRVFTFKKKDYDKSLDYAENEYKVTISEKNGSHFVQLSLLETDSKSPSEKLKELNQQILRLQGAIN